MADLDLGQLIRERAYRRWQERGAREGSPDEDWFEAEREIQALDRTVSEELSEPAELPDIAASGQPA